ncbi:helix-turn-helix domain-containing protein [Cetobacterium sp.]|uniref:helix-turn-helix domain-containing protein n=3 Tax=Cetobacterium sp. TaxID=2071632 RepID=UPI003EE7DCAB
MSLNRKDFEIIRLVSNEKINLKELALNFKTTDRNIRYSIDNINHYLKKISKGDNIEVVNGVIKFDSDENLVKKFCGEENKKDYIFSKEEREEYILICLFFQEVINLKVIEEYFQVSITTLRKDLKDIEKILEKYQLYLENSFGKIFIKGNEKKLRHLKMIYALKYIYLNEEELRYIEKLFFFQKDILLILKNYLSGQNVKRCFDILKTFEKKLKIKFEKEFKNIIFIYLIVTFERIEKGHILLKKNNWEFLKNTTYYKIIQKDVFKNNNSYMYEALHLSEYFLSGHNSESFYENRFLIDSFVCKLLNILSEIKIENLIDDKEFLEEIIEYLTAAIYRVKNNFILNYKLELDENEDKVYDKISKNRNIINKYLKEPLRNEEFMLIAKIICKHLRKPKIEKIKLNKILEIIEKNSEKPLLSTIKKELLGLYPNLIEDNIKTNKQLSLLDVITEKDIKFARCYDIKELIDISISNLYENSFIEREFIDSLHMMLEKKEFDYIDNENTLIFYGKETKYNKKLGVSIIFNEENIKLENKEIKYFILLSNVDKYNYLGVMRDLQKIIEENRLKELSELQSQKSVIERIAKIIA